MNKDSNTSSIIISIRATEDVRDNLQELAELMSDELGMKVSKAQVFERLINNALKERKRTKI